MARLEYSEDMVPIDVDVLTRAVGISPDNRKQNMNEGTITRRTGRSEGDDADQMPLALLSHDQRVRTTAHESGKVLTRNAVYIERSSTKLSRKARLDAFLDETLDESFPASVPIVVSCESPDLTAPYTT